MSRATIASIYPYPLTAERPLYGGKYSLPAVQRGEAPFLLEITDKTQIEYGWFSQGRPQMRHTIMGKEEIAPDILKEWAANAPGMTEQCGPGIWIVREDVYEPNEAGEAIPRPATEAEKKAMFASDWETAKARQAAWFEYQIMQGDRIGEDPKTRPYVTPLMKLAAKYMGRSRKWLEEMRDGDVKACPFCTRHIPVGAVKCPECGEIVDFERYAELEARKKAAVAAVAPREPEPELVGANPR